MPPERKGSLFDSRANPPAAAPKPVPLSKRAAEEFADFYGQARLTPADKTIFVVGWGMAEGHTGHVAREWIPGSEEWGPPFALKTTADLRATAPTDMPGPAPEGPQK